ncbi:MAG TPA: permease-like cell division protein FtsX [Gammaproteobacteria bacterium]|nr:permease-like cell division protein FtsX [Gammaproteobacteria bacterium]
MNYLTRHIQSGLYSLGKLFRSPFSSLMTCLIIGIALALPALLFVALKNAEAMSGSIKQTLAMTIYLKQDTSSSQVYELLQTLKSQKEIKNARAISPADGLKELQKQAGLDSALEKLTDNPLPWVILVEPNTKLEQPVEFETLSHSLEKLPQVDNIQLDILWVKRLASFMSLAHRILFALAIFLSIAVLLIVNSMIRSATEQHHKEIEIIKLIGGTYAFIRRPFLYAGMAYGLFGGLLAWLLVTLLVLALKSPAEALSELYGNQFSLAGMGLSNFLVLLSGSIGLGLAGSWLAVTKYLHEAQ